MKEIFYNEHYLGRTPEEQQIINLLTDYFPDCGFPRLIISDENYIAIASQYGNNRQLEENNKE